MADKGIRCKLCGERHPGGMHVSPTATKAVVSRTRQQAEAVTFIPSRYDEAGTFIPDIWEPASLKPVTNIPDVTLNEPVTLMPVRRGRPKGVAPPMTPVERQRRHRAK